MTTAFTKFMLSLLYSLKNFPPKKGAPNIRLESLMDFGLTSLILKPSGRDKKEVPPSLEHQYFFMQKVEVEKNISTDGPCLIFLQILRVKIIKEVWQTFWRINFKILGMKELKF